jgi:hypothetical protein
MNNGNFDLPVASNVNSIIFLGIHSIGRDPDLSHNREMERLMFVTAIFQTHSEVRDGMETVIA